MLKRVQQYKTRTQSANLESCTFGPHDKVRIRDRQGLEVGFRERTWRRVWCGCQLGGMAHMGFVAKSMQLDRLLAIGLLYADGFQAVA
jgi:hypothetical protein